MVQQQEFSVQAMPFIANSFSEVKRISIWKSFDLYHILDQGDKLMKFYKQGEPFELIDFHYLLI